jgi:hypothetical protein
METETKAAIDWLMSSDEPGIRYQARRDLLDEDRASDAKAIMKGPKVRALLAGQESNGGFGGHPYRKWAGAHWRLVSLVELGVPPGDRRVLAAAETVLNWLTGPVHRRSVKTVNGLTRRCASQEGNALAVCCRVGLADDPRTELLARSLVEWQWPDGGWNCDPDATGRRSSFHESLRPAWGLSEYWRVSGEPWAKRAYEHTAELFLSHRIYQSSTDGSPINKQWLSLHYPAYWHYDILEALVMLARLGYGDDSRADDALDLIEERRLPDGRWRPGAYWWREPSSTSRSTAAEVVDWGRSGPNEMLTLNALRVLRAAGRW